MMQFKENGDALKKEYDDLFALFEQKELEMD